LETIKVNIAGKDFPLTVEAGSQKDVIQAAALINQKIKQYQDQFKVDAKDALSMCALEYITQTLQLQKEAGDWEAANGRIDIIHHALRGTEL
jgi:cell division protein ZapA (FtsZ GTPase activity inhibitor)